MKEIAMKLMFLLFLLSSFLGNSLQFLPDQPNNCITFKTQIQGYDHSAYVTVGDQPHHLSYVDNGQSVLPKAKADARDTYNVKVRSYKQDNSYFPAFISTTASARCAAECTLKRTINEDQLQGTKLECFEPVPALSGPTPLYPS